ncbi:MAG: EboA domain-containing protein [Lentisphaeraceae bacterium]|nr:EboA domain-containing protein [Lentisphaeraceae bacterium]
MQNILLKITAALKCATEKQPRAASFWESFETIGELDLDQFIILSSGALRRLGRKEPEFSDEIKQLIQDVYPSLAEKNAGFIGRFLLAVNAPTSECVDEMITRGNDDEQAAAIMAVNFRDDAELFKDKVVHACRTNSTTVHSAVSQGNPYPAKYFDDQEFKQLTIKTIFMGLDFDKIVDLENRFNGELGQSLTDFFEERRAAGRWLPDNVLEFMKRKGLIS